MRHGLKKAVCVSGILQGFGFGVWFFISWQIFFHCLRVVFFSFLVFYKRLCPVKQWIFLISWWNRINCAHSALFYVFAEESSQNGHTRSRWFTLLWFITSLVLWISEKDLHAALHTSVSHFLWLVTNHIRLEDAWPELSLQGCVRAGKGIFCAEFFKSWSASMVSWVPQFK